MNDTLVGIRCAGKGCRDTATHVFYGRPGSRKALSYLIVPPSMASAAKLDAAFCPISRTATK